MQNKNITCFPHLPKFCDKQKKPQIYSILQHYNRPPGSNLHLSPPPPPPKKKREKRMDGYIEVLTLLIKILNYHENLIFNV